MADQTFWSNAATEPKRKYRFTFSVGPLEIFTITKVTRPSFEVSLTTLSTTPARCNGRPSRSP